MNDIEAKIALHAAFPNLKDTIGFRSQDKIMMAGILGFSFHAFGKGSSYEEAIEDAKTRSVEGRPTIYRRRIVFKSKAPASIAGRIVKNLDLYGATISEIRDDRIQIFTYATRLNVDHAIKFARANRYIQTVDET